MEINQLRLFARVAVTENMTRAAAELKVAQPALSKTVRLLENELGYPLFDRVGKYIYLNENGRILLRHATAILRELEDARTEILEANDRKDNEVVLSMQAASKLLPSLISGFRKRHPTIKLSVIQEEKEGLEMDKWDICIMSSREPMPQHRSLLQEDILLSVPSTHPLAGRDSIRLEEVAEENFIALQKGKALREITDQCCHQAGFSPNIVLESDNPNVIRELLKLDIGICMIPQITWMDDSGDRQIRSIPITDPECTRCLNLVVQDRSYKPEAVQHLEDYLIAFFATLQEQRH